MSLKDPRVLSRRAVVGVPIGLVALGAAGHSAWPRLRDYQAEVEKQRQVLSSSPKRSEIIRMASLAASGHNAQPWRFSLTERGVCIHPDMSRRTRVVDPDDHHLFISLGCATENLTVAAAALGRRAETAFQDGASPFVYVEFGSGAANDFELCQAIPFRQSTRSIYDGRRLSVEELGALGAAASFDGVTVQMFTDASDLESILEAIIEGNNRQMDNPAFIEELTSWLRFSSGQALASMDGLFAPCSGNPVTPAWLGRPIFNAAFRKPSEAKRYTEQVRSSAGVAVFVSDQESPEYWVRVGRSFQRMALQATVMGVRTAHLNQPVEVSSIRREFAVWLGAAEKRPNLVVRFGRAPQLPMSLRRPVTDVML